MVTYASGNKPITVPAPLDVYQHIAAIARAEDMALGQAALLLIRRAIDDGGESDAHTPTEDDRQSRLIADDAATPAPLPLESIALEALLAEIRRRVENAADDEALGEAIARAEAAEGKLAQLRAALA